MEQLPTVDFIEHCWVFLDSNAELTPSKRAKKELDTCMYLQYPSLHINNESIGILEARIITITCPFYPS